MVKNLPAMQEMQVHSGSGRAPEEGNSYSSILAWEIPWPRGAWQARVRGVTKRRTRLGD